VRAAVQPVEVLFAELFCVSCAVVAGLTHGAGIIPGANIGKNGALFEQGVRSTGSDIAGKDVVNPTGWCISCGSVAV
jgi:isocitrate/isopropylmalate dehydrogenase